MAFREAYTRLVEEARRRHMPAAWSASLGFDKDRRDQAITAAVIAGRLPADDLPRLASNSWPMLSLSNSPDVPQHARDALRALSASLKAREDAESEDALARKETDRLKARAAELVAEYERQKVGNEDPS
jgi:hypothetical protein